MRDIVWPVRDSRNQFVASGQEQKLIFRFAPDLEFPNPAFTWISWPSISGGFLYNQKPSTRGNTMAEPKPLYDLTDKELAQLMRDYPRGIHPTYGHDLGAESERRQGIRNRRLTLIAVIVAAVSAFCSAAAASRAIS
jgi:hypothetical protein